jgi:hypothetical protein
MLRKMLRTPFVAVGCLLLTLALALAYVPHSSLAQPSSRYFPETQHYVKGVFLKYWQEHGGLAQQGYPLTEEFREVSKSDGKEYTVQYFERAVFEYHPEYAGSSSEVLLSQLGKFELDDRYPNNSNPAANPIQTLATVGDTILLPDNVSLTLTDKVFLGAGAAVHTTGISTLCGSKYMYWVFQATNTSNESVLFLRDVTKLALTDDTGSTYNQGGACGLSSLENWMSSALPLSGGSTWTFAVGFDINTLPANAIYLDFEGNIMHTDVAFRYPVAGPPPPPPTPTSDLANLPYCKAQDLTASADLALAAGIAPGTIEVTNVGNTVCILAGYPTIQLYTEHGPVQPITPRDNPYFPPHPVALHPGSKAVSYYLWTNWCGAALDSNITLTAGLPNDGGQLGPITVLDRTTNQPTSKTPVCDDPTETSNLKIDSFMFVEP